MTLIFSLFLMLSYCVFVETYKILGIFPYCSHSHFTLGFRLMKELADRGHEITFVNCFPQKTALKNFRDISVEDMKKKILDYYDINVLKDRIEFSYYSLYNSIDTFSQSLTTAVLKNKNIHTLMQSNETFDLVIAENLFADCLVVFAHKFNCPLVMFSPGPASIYNNYMLGNPAPPSYVTNLFAFDYHSTMNFWQRLDNSFGIFLGQIHNQLRLIPEQNAMLKEHFPNAPDITPILYNTSLLLVASDVSISGPVPSQPNIQDIGGYHILPPKPLSKELKDFMDRATEGVVVFSMGSLLKSSDFKPEKKKAVLEAFSRIRQKVLWKFEEDMPEKPDNLKIVSWLPQSDVLAHPNVVAFISHGGVLGVTEAVYHGVPILGLPVFFDQWRNIALAVGEGYAVKLLYTDLNGESFYWALNEILNNPKYKKVAKERSAIMHDKPIKPMDKAVFWCEYVIRHKGAPHLRSAAVDLRWYQLYLLDVVLFAVAVITVITVIFRRLIIFLCRCRKRKNVEKEKKNI